MLLGLRRSPFRLRLLCKGEEVGGDGHDFDQDLRHDISATLWQAVLAYSGGRRDVADDAVAEASRRSPTQRSGAESKAYLYRIAFRLAAAELKRDGRAGTSVESEHHDELPLADLGPALRQLSPSQRAAVFLHYEADLPVRVVARLMGTSAAAVKVHLVRGHRRLADLLREEDDG